MNDETTFERLTGNRAIETAGVLWVMQLERDAGRNPIDRRSERGFPGDIVSHPRIIEVKAVGGDARGADLPLEVPQIERARADPNFHLYFVDRVAQGNPKLFCLKVFHGEQLGRLLSRGGASAASSSCQCPSMSSTRRPVGKPSRVVAAGDARRRSRP